MDVMYIRMPTGFVNLGCVEDIYSRKILSSRIGLPPLGNPVAPLVIQFSLLYLYHVLCSPVPSAVSPGWYRFCKRLF